MAAFAHRPTRLMAAFAVLTAAWPLLPTATATPIRRGRISFDGPSSLSGVDPFLENLRGTAPPVLALPDCPEAPPFLIGHEWIFKSMRQHLGQTPLSTLFFWPDTPVKRLGDTRLSGSVPFRLVEQMPDSYAGVMFGLGSLLLTASSLMAYCGRRIAPYSHTGERNPTGGQPPLAQLVLSSEPNVRARS